MSGLFAHSAKRFAIAFLISLSPAVFAETAPATPVVSQIATPVTATTVTPSVSAPAAATVNSGANSATAPVTTKTPTTPATTAPAPAAKPVPQPLGFEAGAGKSLITFRSDNFPLDGFVSQHDPLGMRVLILKDANTQVALVVADMTSLSSDLITKMKSIVSELTQIPASNIIISASHTFSAPHIFMADQVPPDTDSKKNAYMLSEFESALALATKKALSAVQPASIGMTSTLSRIAVNRDLSSKFGWWLGANDSGFTDPYVGVLQVNGKNNEPIAMLVNYAVQPSVTEYLLDDGKKQMSSDLSGALTAYLEKNMPLIKGADATPIAFFLEGAAGDQQPILRSTRYELDEDGNAIPKPTGLPAFTLNDLLGQRLGSQVVRAMNDIKLKKDVKIQLVHATATLPSLKKNEKHNPIGPVKSFSYQSGPDVASPYVILSMGDLTWVGVQPELAAEVGAYIRKNSPLPNTFVSTMVNGGAKYLPDQKSYDRFTYEARNSQFAKGAAESFAKQIIAKLKTLQEKK